MTSLMIRYEMDPQSGDRVEEQVRRAMAAVDAAGFDGVTWRYWRVAGTNEMVAILDLADGMANPLPDIAEARALQVLVAEVAVGVPPVARPLHLIAACDSALAERDRA